MSIKEIIQTEFPMLIEEGLVNEISAVAKIEEMAETEILIDMNERITRVPLLIDGSLKIIREEEDGREIFLYYVEAGNTCAASITCCLNNHKSSIMAIVEEKARFLSIPIEYMDQWMAKYQSWRNFIMNSFTSRTDELLEVVDLLAFKKMDERILKYLQGKSELQHSNIIKASHQEIANDLSTSREVVSRLLKQMEHNRMLKISRGKIELLS
jgi:CRP/FNR family transcriptional regulator